MLPKLWQFSRRGNIYQARAISLLLVPKNFFWSLHAHVEQCVHSRRETVALRNLAITSNNVCGYHKQTKRPNCWTFVPGSLLLYFSFFYFYFNFSFTLGNVHIFVGGRESHRFLQRSTVRPYCCTHLWCLPLCTWEVRIGRHLSSAWETFGGGGISEEDSYSKSSSVLQQMIEYWL